MGFNEQPNGYTCGPFALKHALVTLGQLATEDAISSVAKPLWWSGTDERRLARAARSYDCDLPVIRRTDPERARRELVRYVGRKIPVLLCVDKWDHWITVVGHQGGARFVVLDSTAEPVLNVVTWAQLRARWQYVKPDNDNNVPWYDLHPVKPRFHVPISARLSVVRAQFLRRPENVVLARHWDQYLEDLLAICRPRSARSATEISFGEFMRRNRKLLLDRVTYWHGDISREELSRLLRNFKFVAETYGLVIRASSTRRATTDLAILLALYAGATRGVDAMYGSPAFQVPRPRRKAIRA